MSEIPMLEIKRPRGCPTTSVPATVEYTGKASPVQWSTRKDAHTGKASLVQEGTQKSKSGTEEYTERCPGREEDGDQHNAYCSAAERAASASHAGGAERGASHVGCEERLATAFHVEVQEAQRK